MFLLYVSSFCSFYFAIFVLIRTVFDFTNRELIFPVADLLFIIQFTSDSGMINFRWIRSGNHERKMRIRCSRGIRAFSVIFLFIDNRRTLG